nr:hypothetical protein [Nocardioides seonyuensis]
MGQGRPAQGDLQPEHKRYGEGGEFRALYDGDADVRRVVDTAMGIEGSTPVGVHAAGVIMSSEPLIDVTPAEAPGRRGDDHPVRLPHVRVPGPDQDGLPGLRNLTSSTTRSRTSRQLR